MDSPVFGELRTIGSILSPEVLAPCFPFGLGDSGELSIQFSQGISGTLANLLPVVARCFVGFILLLTHFIIYVRKF
jgi:hypothetical protein